MRIVALLVTLFLVGTVLEPLANSHPWIVLPLVASVAIALAIDSYRKGYL